MEHKHHAAISLALLLSIIILISCTYLSVNDSPHINENEQNHRSTTHQRQLTIVDPKTVHLRSSSPLTTLVKSDAEDLQSRHQCPLRELPDISSWQAPEEFNIRGRRQWKSEWDNNCLKFECDRDIDRCDTMELTNYDDPSSKPCCVHILRDMAKAFDDVMCELGLEYYASYGMLLGLIRADKLIPWTADNDYIVTKQTISALLALSEEEKQVFTKHGISFFYDNMFYRVCAAPTFAEGKLASSWTRTTKSSRRYDNNYPYADVFVAEEKDGYMVDQLNCAHPIEVFKPIVYKPVYNGSFHVAFPNNPQKVLDGAFGDDWKTPDSGHKKHGNTSCRNGGIKFTK